MTKAKQKLADIKRMANLQMRVIFAEGHRSAKVLEQASYSACFAPSSPTIVQIPMPCPFATFNSLLWLDPLTYRHFYGCE